MPSAEAARQHWRGTRRITSALLAVWLVVTFVVAFFARELGGTVLGWPFSFWVAAQGAPIVYLVLVCIYARRMRLLDDEQHMQEED